MNDKNILLLPAFVERVKDAARAVKQGVFVSINQITDTTLTQLLGLTQIKVRGYGIEQEKKQDIVHIYGEINTKVAICPCCHSLSTTIKEKKRVVCGIVIYGESEHFYILR